MIKAIYHVPFYGLELCRDLGFNYVNLYLWDSRDNEEFYEKAHSLGLHCIISGNDFIFLFKKHCDQCLVELPDEPNRSGIKPEAICDLSREYKQSGWKTIVTLADTHPYSGYENSADYIAFNNYELDFRHFFKLWIKIKIFQIKNKSKIIAIPAIKPGKILRQFNWWEKWIKSDGYYWYAWTISQEKWATKDIDELLDVQRDLKIVNL